MSMTDQTIQINLASLEADVARMMHVAEFGGQINYDALDKAIKQLKELRATSAA